MKPKLVEAQRDAIRDDSKKLKTVGRDVVNGLREQVKNQLVKAIEPPIRRRCEKFIRENLDTGAGVRNRILDLFDELADEALDAAVPPARKVLREGYGQVEREIREVFFDHHQSPLDSAADAIVSSHEDRVRRSDAQKRRAILAESEAVVASLPAAASVGGFVAEGG